LPRDPAEHTRPPSSRDELAEALIVLPESAFPQGSGVGRSPRRGQICSAGLQVNNILQTGRMDHKHIPIFPGWKKMVTENKHLGKNYFSSN